MTDDTDDQPLVLTERRGPVLIVTINRPGMKNAVNKATAQEISAAMDELEATDELFAGVITGAGGTFCAGADLKAARAGETDRRTHRGGFGLFEKPPMKPLVAAVEGHAVAGGFELCLACDIVIAAKNAKMGLPEARHNLVAIGGGLFRLPRRMPYHLAMELALTGEIRPVEEFHRWGVVNRLVEPGTALEEALAFLERVLENGPTALSATKEIMFRSADWSQEEAWRHQMPIARRAFESEDRAEGLQAFAEKRRPVWKGR